MIIKIHIKIIMTIMLIAITFIIVMIMMIVAMMMIKRITEKDAQYTSMQIHISTSERTLVKIIV